MAEVRACTERIECVRVKFMVPRHFLRLFKKEQYVEMSLRAIPTAVGRRGNLYHLKLVYHGDCHVAFGSSQ
jgi:hypothetical protein